MASWGREAEVALTGTGSASANTNVITGSGTAFTTELEASDIVVISTDAYRVTEVVSNTVINVEPLTEAAYTAQAMTSSKAPKYLPVADIPHVVLVQDNEIDANTRADGIKTPGWTLYEEYGSGRKRVETLVAMKSTS